MNVDFIKTVALDCYAEKPYEEFVFGALDAVREYGCKVILVGKEDRLESMLSKGNFSELLKIVNAVEEVWMGDSYKQAMYKKDSSMIRAVGLVKNGDADCFVTAGNTGVAAVMARKLLGHLEVTKHNPIIARLPCLVDGSIKSMYGSDLGARVDATAEHLVYTAIMESCFLKYVCGIENPRIALLNIGEEDSKGDSTCKMAYEILEKSSLINFVGNIEPNEAPFGSIDAFVCSGTNGNISLKSAEGMGKLIYTYLKSSINQGPWYQRILKKAGALLLSPVFRDFKEVLDRETYGGAAVLGIAKPVVISHGASGRKAIKKSIGFALQIADSNLESMIAEMEEKIGEVKKYFPESWPKPFYYIVV